MKLILTQEVTGLGAAGDVVEVKDGYGRNYLVPRGLGIRWSRGGEKTIESIKTARAYRAVRDQDHAGDVKAKLEATPVVGDFNRDGVTDIGVTAMTVTGGTLEGSLAQGVATVFSTGVL